MKIQALLFLAFLVFGEPEFEQRCPWFLSLCVDFLLRGKRIVYTIIDDLRYLFLKFCTYSTDTARCCSPVLTELFISWKTGNDVVHLCVKFPPVDHVTYSAMSRTTRRYPIQRRRVLRRRAGERYWNGVRRVNGVQAGATSNPHFCRGVHPVYQNNSRQKCGQMDLTQHFFLASPAFTRDTSSLFDIAPSHCVEYVHYSLSHRMFRTADSARLFLAAFCLCPSSTDGHLVRVIKKGTQTVSSFALDRNGHLALDQMSTIRLRQPSTHHHHRRNNSPNHAICKDSSATRAVLLVYQNRKKLRMHRMAFPSR